jgi:ATP-dependent Clp protease ATP-binding subunit ClpA
MRLAEDVQIALSVAMSEARRLRHEYVGLEHLLYALALDHQVAKTLQHAGADVELLRRLLVSYLEAETTSEENNEPFLTLAVQRVLNRAGAMAQSAGRDKLQGNEVLVALFEEPDSYATSVLAELGVKRLDVVSYLAHGVSKHEPRRRQVSPDRMPAGVEGEEEETAGDALSRYTQELVALARQGGIDPLIGREREIQRMQQILQRRRKNNPVLVGDPGVGKTALVEGLAWKVALDRIPPVLRETPIYRLDMGALVAGTRYRGDFEERLKEVLKALAEQPKAILFIDEVHTVIGAGSAGQGTLDASNLLKPALESGKLRCIGSTTWKEYRQIFERDHALARRFQKVEVSEPSLEETTKILDGLRERYEDHHSVHYTKPALRVAAELASRHLRDRRLPDKAIDLLDEAGSAAALAGRQTVGAADVERVLATMAQIPPQRVQGNDRARLEHLEESLKKTVFGQDQAVHRLVQAIKVARAGLRQAERPVGCFLLTGPTGVGKTEVSKQLAAALGIAFLRFDMSEYMEAHSVSRLVGAPPGYVGFDRGGLLTEAVSQSPHAVLLLDEIEKAHPDVFNILLQVMDHGTLTDTNGKQTDFRHVILLMTSNIGAREAARTPPGFGAAGLAPSRLDERAYERLFSPEFRNRLDARLDFNPLDPSVMEQIVDKLIGELRDQLAAKKVRILLDPEARTLLAKKGYDPAFGARPLGRVLDELIKTPLTEELLFGRLQNGGSLSITTAGDEIRLDVEP